MFVEAGDTIEGKDGHEWLVCAIAADGTLTLWREGRDVFVGKPSGSVKIVRVRDQEAIETVMAQFPGAAVVAAVGGTTASLIGYRMIRAHASPAVHRLIERSRSEE